MKALILSGGKGTRLRPLTYTGAKQLVPVANKPILWYGIEAIVAAGIREIGIIISPETGEEVRTKTGTGERFGASITYILQAQPAGLAHAVSVAREFLADSPFIMYLGDNLIADPLQSYLEDFQQHQLDALVLLHQVSNPGAFGVAELDSQGNLIKLVEKPLFPPSNLALVGIYFFQPSIHQAIAHIQPSPRGELEITDAIDTLIHQRRQVVARELKSWWLDTGKKTDLLEANRLILDTQPQLQMDAEVDQTSQIIGRVTILPHSQIINSTIRGPVTIGSHCQITNCFIGPYTSIGNGVELTDIDLEHSVILEGAHLKGIPQRIVDSVIGQRVKLELATRPPKALRFLVGDDSQIELI